MKTLEKRPQDHLLIPVSYNDRLASSDSITASDWIVPTGLTKGAHDKADTHNVYLVVSGGTALETYALKNTITTAQGEIKYTVIPLFVKSEESAALS